MEQFDIQGPMIGFRVSFKAKDCTDALNGLYRKDGLAGSQEAKHFGQILQITPVLAATCDRLCGEPGTTTRLFVEYVDLVYKMSRVRAKSAAFTAVGVDDVRSSIHDFVRNAETLYRDHQASEMAFPKLHTLLHAPTTRWREEGLRTTGICPV